LCGWCISQDGNALLRQAAQRGEGAHHAVGVRLHSGRQERGDGVDHQQPAALRAEDGRRVVDQGPPVRVARLAGKRPADQVSVRAEDESLPALLPEVGALLGKDERHGGANRQAEQFAIFFEA
jgi:hypothetical protein